MPYLLSRLKAKMANLRVITAGYDQRLSPQQLLGHLLDEIGDIILMGSLVAYAVFHATINTRTRVLVCRCEEFSAEGRQSNPRIRGRLEQMLQPLCSVVTAGNTELEGMQDQLKQPSLRTIMAIFFKGADKDRTRYRPWELSPLAEES